MPDLTRRRALLAVASGVTALAGCTGSKRGDHVTIDRRREDRPIEDYEARHVRNEDGAVLFTTNEQIPTVTDEERRRYAVASRRVVVSADQLEELTFGDASEADRLSEFARATDFDSASLYLLAMPVGACFEIHLRSVMIQWQDLANDDLHPYADFCEAYRPADVDCGADERHTTGFAIRLPVAAENSTGSGRGMSSHCGRSPRGEYFHATVTPADGGDAE